MPENENGDSARELRTLVESAPFPIGVYIGRELRIKYANQAIQNIWGKGEDVIGKRYNELLPELESQAIFDQIKRVFETGTAFHAKNQRVDIIVHGKLQIFYFNYSFTPLFNEEGKVYGILNTGTDVTDLVKARQQAEESDLFVRNIIYSSEAAQMIWTGPELICTMANEKMLALLGLDTPIIGKPYAESMQPVAGEKFTKAIYHVLQTGETFHQPEERFVIHHDGKTTTAYFNYSFKALKNNAGETSAIICTVIDMTEQVRAREKIAASEQNFRSLVMQAPVGICIVQKENNFVEIVNNTFLALVGRSRAELEHKNYWDVLAEAAHLYEPILRGVFESGSAYSGKEHRVTLLRNGKEEVVYISFVYEPIKDADGRVNRVMIVGLDVTAQVTARKEVETAEEKLRLAIESAELGTYEIDYRTGEAVVSPRMQEMWGVEPELSWKRLASFLHPDDLQMRNKAQEQALQTSHLQYEARVVRSDGRQLWVRINGKVLFNENKEPSYLLGVVQDITEQKAFSEQLELQVRERTHALEKLNGELKRSNANLEEFAHAASHDLKEPIRKIQYFTERLHAQLSEKMDSNELFTLSRIENASHRMGLLIDDLLLYSHVSLQPLEKEVIDLNDKIRKVLDDLELDIERKKAVINVGPLPAVRGYRRQLQQLFQNLISNALKYAKPGLPPEIDITAHTEDGGAVGLVPGQQYHVIEVRDKGIGFEPSESEKIFQMFQRLHGRNEYPGTGIGLSIVRKVAENHKGKVTAEGIPGEGAVFRVYLMG